MVLVKGFRVQNKCREGLCIYSTLHRHLSFSSCNSYRKQWCNNKTKMNTNFKEYLSQSSMHGLGHIPNSKSSFKMIFWAIISIVALLVLCVHLTIMVLKFYEHGYTETTSLRNEMLKFPDVTICSYSAFDAHKLQHSEFLNISSLFYQNIFDELKRQYAPDSIISRDEFLSRRSIYANTDQNMRDWLGYEWQDIILKCRMAGETCNRGHFVKRHQTDFFQLLHFRSR